MLRGSTPKTTAGSATGRRVKTPTVLQQETAECGIATLAIILAYYGRHLPLSQLRSAAGVGRGGTDASTLLRVARRFGLKGTAYRREPGELKELGFPLVVHYRFVHYVVVEGMSEDRVFLNDPESGPYDVAREEFDEDFTGICLAFEPAESAARTGRPFCLTVALVRRLAGYEMALSLIAGWSGIIAVLVVATAMLLQTCVDRLFAAGPESRGVTPLLCVLLAVLTARLTAAAVQRLQLRRLENTLSTDWTEAFLDHVTQLPLSFFTSRVPRNVQAVIELNGCLAQQLCTSLVPIFSNLLALPILAGAMIWSDAAIGLTVLLCGSLQLLIASVVYRDRARAFRRLQHAKCGAAGLAPNVLRNIESAKVGGGADSAFAVATGQQAKLLNATQGFGAAAATARVAAQLLFLLACAAVLAIGALHISDGTLTVGALVALYSMTPNLFSPLTALLDNGDQVERLRQNLFRLDDVLAVAAETSVRPAPQLRTNGAAVANRVAGHLELVDIRFRYSPQQPFLLEGLSLEVQPGERVGIVGPSGTGKSTLARLICGLLRPCAGHVRWDGELVEDLDRKTLASTVGLVEQGTPLFDTTVERNVSSWRDDVGADVMAALEDALIWHVVAGQNGQTQRHLLPWNPQLSSGEIQRLQIARALAQNPALIILDEATDSLDLETERQIMWNLRRRGCGVLLIGQRSESLACCDRVFRLEGGRLHEINPRPVSAADASLPPEANLV